MKKLLDGIKNALDERGITDANHNYRVAIIEREIIGNSDWAYVTVNITPPRKRKATLSWKLAINFVRNVIDWEKSSFVWLNK